MSGLVEPNRRRLTVGMGGDRPGVLAGMGGTLEAKDFGLEKAFADAAAAGKRAIVVHTVLDHDAERRQSFDTKDEQVLFNGVFEDDRACKKWVNELTVARRCCKGKKPESPNQDGFCMVTVEDDFALYCVFDGHGPSGHDISNFCTHRLVRNFMENRGTKEPKEALKCAFLEMQEAIKREGDMSKKAQMSGTTCTVAYHQFSQRSVLIAHVGDSRAIISGATNARRAEDLTADHKPNLPEEKRRIEAAGGRVIFDGFYNHRVFSSKGQYPGLNMSRALGDLIGHAEAGLTAEPEIREVELTEQPRLLLLCTDGVWEFVESVQAIELFMRSKVPKDMKTEDLQVNLERLTKEAYDRWMKDSEGEISDDITGIAVLC